MSIVKTHPVLIALLVAGAFFMENLDGTVIATALPQMAVSFGSDAVDLNIGMTAYLLTLAVFIPCSGWVADRFGFRNVFCGAIIVFTAASIFCGASTGLWMFTFARILQGIGGAMMVPVGRLIVLRSTEKQHLMRSIAYITWPGLAAPLLGPPVGGFLAAYASWRWIFFLNVPLGVIALGLALWLIPNVFGEVKKRFDWLGFALSGIACASLMYALTMLGRQDIQWRLAVPPLLVALVFGSAAFWHIGRSQQPIVDLSALRVRTFAITIWGGSLFRVAISAVPFLLPLMFQIGFGMNAFKSGLLVLAVFAGNIGMKPGTSWVLRSFGFRTVLIGNGLIAAASMFACAVLQPDTSVVITVVVLFIGGLARSMQFTGLNTLAFADVPKPQMSGANTLFSMAQQMSLGIGIAIGAIVLRFGAWLHPGASSAPTIADFHLAFAAIGVLSLLALFDCVSLAADAGASVSLHRAAPRNS